MRLPEGLAVRNWVQKVVRAWWTYRERFEGEVGWTWLCLLLRLWRVDLDVVLVFRSWRRGCGGPMAGIWSNKLLAQ